MRKYRTKSGTVEEKLPGVNATVNPSEKAQIAMAGGADTLKDVQTILGQEGKRNNLKGQGAKHLVSFYTGEGPDSYGDDMGAEDSPSGPSGDDSFGDDPGFDPSMGGQFRAGGSGSPFSTGVGGGGGGPSGGTASPLYDPPPDPAKEKPSPTLYDWQREESGIKAYQRDIQSILLDPDRDRTIPTDEESKKARKSSLEKANAARTRTEVLQDMRKHGLPENLKGLVAPDFMGPPTLNQAKNIERRQEERGVKGLDWAKDKLDEFTLPGIEKSIVYNRRKSGNYGVETDPSGFYVGLGLGVISAAAPFLAPSLAPAAKTVEMANTIYMGGKMLTAPPGYPSSDPNRSNYQRDTLDSSTTPPPGPDLYNPDDPVGEAQEKQKKRPPNPTKHVTLAVAEKKEARSLRDTMRMRGGWRLA
jgi:hypothetical protein